MKGMRVLVLLLLSLAKPLVDDANLLKTCYCDGLMK